MRKSFELSVIFLILNHIMIKRLLVSDKEVFKDPLKEKLLLNKTKYFRPRLVCLIEDYFKTTSRSLQNHKTTRPEDSLKTT